MARRPPIEYVLLTQARSIFAFRTLRQLIYFLDRYGKHLRQRRRGRRRHVHILDLALAMLSHGRRLARQLYTGHEEAPRETDEARGETDEVRRENKHLKGFLKDHHLFQSWERSFQYVRYSPLD